MSEKLSNEKVAREVGALYFIGKDGNAWQTDPARKPNKRPKKMVKVFNIKKEKGYLYFIDKEGYPCRSIMNRKGRGK